MKVGKNAKRIKMPTCERGVNIDSKKILII